MRKAEDARAADFRTLKNAPSAQNPRERSFAATCAGGCIAVLENTTLAFAFEYVYIVIKMRESGKCIWVLLLCVDFIKNKY